MLKEYSVSVGLGYESSRSRNYSHCHGSTRNRTKKKNNCGRPGINGGYIDNPYIKFGVNCYGKKPTPTENDLNRLEAQQSQPIPITAEDKELQEKIDYWKKNSDKLQLNSFNNNNWSRY